MSTAHEHEQGAPHTGPPDTPPGTASDVMPSDVIASVRTVSDGTGSDGAVSDGTARDGTTPDVTTLVPILRRVVGARVSDPTTAEDLIQETVVRVLAAADRIEPGMFEPYAVRTARNLVATMWKEQDRHRRNQHRVVDLRPPETPGEELVAQEEQSAMAEALARLSARERNLLLAHEVHGEDTSSLAAETGTNAGAVAAQLARTRARLRVEYLLVAEHAEELTDRCRPVLLALSGGDRRRQREVDAARHVMECELCGRLSGPLTERGAPRDGEEHIPIQGDADIVAARQAARELASRLSFSRTDLTVIATAVSEVARNIVRFAGSGEICVELLGKPRAGVRVTARDTGPGIDDLEQAMADGFSTYRGLGLGLPGARRLMDEFLVTSEPGHGTTVIMTKWREG